MTNFQEIRRYKYIDDRNDVWLVKIRVATALGGGFDEAVGGDLRLAEFPMPNGYMRRMSVKVDGFQKPFMIPCATQFFAPYLNGGLCTVHILSGTATGKVINTFGERWDHNLFRLDTELT